MYHSKYLNTQKPYCDTVVAHPFGKLEMVLPKLSTEICRKCSGRAIEIMLSQCKEIYFYKRTLKPSSSFFIGTQLVWGLFEVYVGSLEGYTWISTWMTWRTDSHGFTERTSSFMSVQSGSCITQVFEHPNKIFQHSRGTTSLEDWDYFAKPQHQSLQEMLTERYSDNYFPVQG